MKWPRRIFISIVCSIVVLWGTLYLFQESILFHPVELAPGHRFRFESKFEELNINSEDGKKLNAVLFKTDSAGKGLIFYLHGNAGSLDSWGPVSKLYTDLGYDVLMPDYRGYGKSEGNITGQEQLFRDNIAWYKVAKERSGQQRIIVLGYSIGSCLAAQIAATQGPEMLILQAPYYSMTDLVQEKIPLIPAAVLRYPLPTFEYLKQCRMPVYIFHGDKDEVIYYGASLKLKKHLKPEDKLFTLHGQGHNGMTENRQYQQEIAGVLR